MGRTKRGEIEISTIKESRPYVLWRRVSTEKQGESGLGLDAQEAIARMFMGKDAVEVFTDVFSGTKLRQCKALWDAIALCKDKDYALVIAKSDRCRNVQEALEILDAVGERNLIFCDLPSSDRFILTVMWAMWERQAIMGRINTKLALAERKKQIERDGGFVSKAGNFCTRLGNKKGCDMSDAHRVAYENRRKAREDWSKESSLYSWVTIQLLKGRPRRDIVAEARELYEKNPEKYCTRNGCPLSEAILSRWAKDIFPVI